MPIEVRKRTAVYFKTNNGSEPAREFIRSIKDHMTRAKIQTKIFRAEQGNFGKEGEGYKHLEGSVWELKISYGPGYRVYFLLDGLQLIVLLSAGDKKTQNADIKKAIEYASDYLITKK